MIEETFITRDKTRLFLRRSDTTSSNKRILIFHGLFEHSVNYPKLMERIFPEGGVSWVSWDMRGHGLSEGVKNEVNAEQYIQDVKDLIQYLKWDEGSFVGLGHSFGALLALYLTCKNPHFFKALLLSSPFLGMPDSRKPLEVAGLLSLSIFLPRMILKNAVCLENLTHDRTRIDQYARDPLIQNEISLGSLRAIHTMQMRVRRMKTLKIPVFILSGSEERVVSQKNMAQWIQNCGSSDLKQRIFKG